MNEIIRKRRDKNDIINTRLMTVSNTSEEEVVGGN